MPESKIVETLIEEAMKLAEQMEAAGITSGEPRCGWTADPRAEPPCPAPAAPYPPTSSRLRPSRVHPHHPQGLRPFDPARGRCAPWTSAWA